MNKIQGLAQQTRRSLADELRGSSRGEESLAALGDLLMHCGEMSRTKEMAVLIGRALIKSEGNVSIIAPCCPDYPHTEGIYTFGGLGTGTSLLCSQHIAFLKNIADILPTINVTFLYADMEADDEVLCQAAGVSREDFIERVSRSIATTRLNSSIVNRQWQVTSFTNHIPGYVDAAGTALGELEVRYRDDSSFRTRITNETLNRRKIYEALGVQLTPEQMIQRTLKTAGQYLALGRYAQAENMLLVNHTTTNLPWFKEAKAAVLHNPIAIY